MNNDKVCLFRQPFHARGRFELVAGCMEGKEVKGVSRKRATELANTKCANYC